MEAEEGGSVSVRVKGLGGAPGFGEAAVAVIDLRYADDVGFGGPVGEVAAGLDGEIEVRGGAVAEGDGWVGGAGELGELSRGGCGGVGDERIG